MNSRQRMMLALNHKEADRIPVDLSSRSSAIEEEAYNDLKKYLGLEKPTELFIRSHAEPDEEVLEKFNVDTRYIRSILPGCWKKDDGEYLFTDQWGVPWKRKRGSFYYDIARFIHNDITTDDISKIQWPVLLTDESIENMRKKAAELHEQTDKCLFTDVLGAGIFESAWYMRGFEKFMMDMALDETFTHVYLDKILELQITAYGKLFDAIGKYVQGVLITDDLAMQDGLLMSPDMYRKTIKPYQKRLYEFIQSKGVFVIYHTCGSLLNEILKPG